MYCKCVINANNSNTCYSFIICLFIFILCKSCANNYICIKLIK